MQPAAVRVDLRPNRADWAFSSGWQKLVLGVALCLPVPVLATSGLAMPLPSVVYRAAVALVGQTQTLVERTHVLAPFEASGTAVGRFLVEPAPSAARWFTRQSAAPAAVQNAVETRVRRVASANHSSEAAPRSEPVRKFAAVSSPGDGESAPALPLEFVANPIPDAVIQFVSRPSSSDPAVRPEPPATGPDQATRAQPRPRDEPQVKHDSPVSSNPQPRDDPPARNEPSPRNEPPTGIDRPPVPRPVPPLPPILGTPPGEDVPVTQPVARSPREILQAIVSELAGTERAGQLENALAKLERAEQELGKTPPDPKAALVNIESAVAEIEAAASNGLLTAAEVKGLTSRLASVARMLAHGAISRAISRSGNEIEIAQAQDRLIEGDLKLAAGEHRSAVGKYRDAFGKAEGA